jgi:1-phosphofructokinase family hexose kinase
MNTNVVTLTLNPAIDQSVAVPGFAAGTVNRVLWEQSDPGGKGVNVASFLADLGHAASGTVTVTGLLGSDNVGEFEQLFNSKGIADAFVRIPGKTRVNVKIIDETTQAITDLNFPGCAANAADLTKLERRIDSLLPEHDWFVLSGSTPAGVADDYYARLIQRLNAAGKRVLLDSSGEAMRLGISATPWAIKPNLVELEELVGTPLPDTPAVIAAARALLAAHPDIDGIFAASDMLALGVLQGIKDMGRSVPGDVALIGFDGIRAGTLADPALTTIEPDLDAAGEALVAMALEDDAHARDGTRIPVRLAVRGTA